MNKTVNAVLIDPFTQKIREVRVRPQYNADIYLHINASTFDVAEFFPRTVNRDGEQSKVIHSVYVDDEGLFRQDQRFWFNKHTGQVLAGKGIVLGLDDEGNSTSCLWTTKGVMDRIVWIGDRASLSVMGQLGVLDRLPRTPQI